MALAGNFAPILHVKHIANIRAFCIPLAAPCVVESWCSIACDASTEGIRSIRSRIGVIDTNVSSVLIILRRARLPINFSRG